jgi:hypothetical protein
MPERAPPETTGGSGSSGDPALEVATGGRSLLQERLALFGKVMVILNLSFWPGFLLMWGREPGAWTASLLPARALAVWIPVNAALALALWLATRGRVRPVRTLQRLDAAAMVAIGAWFSLQKLVHPQPLFAAFDVSQAALVLLLLRALLVPSSWRRTLVLGAAALAPHMATLIPLSRHFSSGVTGPGPLVGTMLNWSLMGLGLSALASGVLYRLRR